MPSTSIDYARFRLIARSYGLLTVVIEGETAALGAVQENVLAQS